MARSWGMVASISLLLGSGALAQTAAAGVADSAVRTANSEWRRLSQNEVNCVDKSLRAKRSGVWFLIQRGIAPTDASVAGIRAGCRTQARAPNAASPVAASPTGELAAAMAASDKAVTDTAAEKAAAEKVAADKAAAAKLAADKAATDKALAEKFERAVKEKEAAEKAAADKVAAEKAAVEKAVADKAAADRAAATKAAGDKIGLNTAADKAAPVKTVTDKAVPDKSADDRARLERAKADAERATAEAARVQAEAERARKEAEKVIADVGFALAAAESKISFVYGFVAGLFPVGFGAIGFVFLRRRMNKDTAQPQAATSQKIDRGTQREFDRLVAAVLDEQKRRNGEPPKQSATASAQRVEEPTLV